MIALNELNGLNDTKQSELEQEISLKKIVSPVNLQSALKPYFGMCNQMVESAQTLTNCSFDNSKLTPERMTKSSYSMQKIKFEVIL